MSMRIFGSLLLLTASVLWLSGADPARAGADVEELAETCRSCHGDEASLPSDPSYPILAGQEFYYLYVQLKDFKSGLRKNELMQDIVAGLDRATMKAIAGYWSEKPWPRTTFRMRDGDDVIAEKLVNSGQCVACHLGTFEGNSRVPRLRNQQPGYLEKTMLDYKYRRRGNAPDIAALFTDIPDEEIAALARYLAAF
ncbi:MAG TPA: cytochrome c4 [Rhodospirillales bacterium]|nr:cytochrome c4 [Rhodospirillales bacterium]